MSSRFFFWSMIFTNEFKQCYMYMAKLNQDKKIYQWRISFPLPSRTAIFFLQDSRYKNFLCILHSLVSFISISHQCFHNRTEMFGLFLCVYYQLCSLPKCPQCLGLGWTGPKPGTQSSSPMRVTRTWLLELTLAQSQSVRKQSKTQTQASECCTWTF